MMSNWWEERHSTDNAVINCVRGLDSRLQMALLGNPADELVDKISQAAEVDPTSFRRVVASLRTPPAFFHFIYHKPRGLLCQPNQRKREAEPSVSTALPPGFPRLPFAGRLDGDTEGLMFFSDNGRLLHALVDPGAQQGHHDGVCKAYMVQVSHRWHHLKASTTARSVCEDGGGLERVLQEEEMKQRAVQSMRQPIDIKGKQTECAEVELLLRPPYSLLDSDFPAVEGQSGPPLKVRARQARKEHNGGKSDADGSDSDIAVSPHTHCERSVFWLSVTLREGRNRQIRRLCARAQLSVLRLVRTALGPLSLAGLPAGQARALSENEVHECYALTQMMPGGDPPCTLFCPTPKVGGDLLHLVPSKGQQI